MRVLMLHNYYQIRGGEDESAEQDAALLRAHGHDVLFRTRHNDEIGRYSVLQKAALFLTPTWSRRAVADIQGDLAEFRPDIVHIQNFFPLFSPAVHVACSRAGVPVVQSLRNYRLLAPCGLLSRDGHVCERCVEGSVINGILLRCYRGSAIQTTSVALMIQVHRLLRTWERHVDAFVALTPFVREKFAEAGMDTSRVVVRSNFLRDDPGAGRAQRTGGVFLGRLMEEKGVRVLLEAWRLLPPDTKLDIVGDGPLLEWASEYARRNGLSSVTFHGRKALAEALEMVKTARFVVVPSVFYETFGRVVMEAFATGTPAVVSGHGAVGSLVDHGRTGLRFTPGDPVDLAEKARYILTHFEEAARWGEMAREEYLQRFTAEPAYRRLVEIYDGAIERRRARESEGSGTQRAGRAAPAPLTAKETD